MLASDTSGAMRKPKTIGVADFIAACFFRASGQVRRGVDTHLSASHGRHIDTLVGRDRHRDAGQAFGVTCIFCTCNGFSFVAALSLP